MAEEADAKKVTFEGGEGAQGVDDVVDSKDFSNAAPLAAPVEAVAPAPVLGEDGRLRQMHLSVQDVSKMKPEELTPLSPEVISRQATINIGTIGHVAHGKSTVVKSLSGVKTVPAKY